MDAVLFDLDDTICTYRRSGREVLAGAFDAVGVDPLFTVEEYYAAYDDYTDDTDTIEALRERCFADLAEAAGADAELGRAVARAFAADRDHREVDFLEGAREALDALEADHRLALVTNGAPEMQRQKLDGLDIRDRFEVIVHGGYDTPAKPSPEPFHAALEAIRVAPDRAVHVGNSLTSDVAGAKNAGVGSVWLRNAEASGDATPDYMIDSMTELVQRPWSA